MLHLARSLSRKYKQCCLYYRTSVSECQWGRGFSNQTSSKLLRFCVVGSGPSGFYTADRASQDAALTMHVSMA